jgi:hypothetical protein
VGVVGIALEHEVMPDCHDCIHFRKAVPPDPFAGWRVLSSKIFELRAKWEKHLADRGLWEQQPFESGLAFDFEPLAYPYCDHFTNKSGVSPAGAPLRYWLCADKNADEDCKQFVTKKATTT